MRLRERHVWPVLWCATLAVAAWFYAMHWTFWVDDTFINLRYAHNILAGYGAVYNPGEVVEGYTSPLFLALVTSLGHAGVDLEIAARALSTGCWVMLVIAAITTTQRLTGNSKPAALIVGMLTAASYPLVIWASAGMETLLYSLLLFMSVTSVLLLSEGQGARSEAATAGILFSAAYLTRPEALMTMTFSVAFLLVLAWREKNKRLVWDAVLIAAMVAVTLAAHIAWRYHYYGDVLPNTYYAKLSGEKHSVFYLMGLHYLWLYVKMPPFLTYYGFLCVVLAMAVVKERRWQIGWLFLFVLCYAAYVVAVGGDWMPASRFLVPLIPIIALVVGLVVAPLLADKSVRVQALLCTAVLLLLMVQPTKYRTEDTPDFPTYWRAIAGQINTHWPKGSLIAINMAGYIPYLTPDYRYLDMLGLNDRYTAKTGRLYSDSKFAAGHQKGDGHYVLRRKPDYIIVQGGFDEGNSIATVLYAAEQELLASPEFKKYYRRVNQPLHPADARILEKKVNFYYYERIRPKPKKAKPH